MVCKSCTTAQWLETSDPPSTTCRSIDYLWDYAERHGVANRMVVVIGSDFGRTNFYNSAEGKDHWPIGSYIVME